jgi:putative selenium metabolism hydrolase
MTPTVEQMAQIRRLAEDNRDAVARFLGEIVRIPSPSTRERAVARRIGEEMQDVGFDEVRFDGLGSVVGRIGSGPRVLAIDGHIDTVDVGDPGAWERDPYSGEIADGRVHGRGSTDQKGGVAAAVYGAKLIKELGLLPEVFSLYVTGTVMEEDCDGLCWQHLIREDKLVPEAALITEPTDCVINRGQRGRMEIKVETSGLSAHGSAPDRGINAIYKMQPILAGVEQLNGRLATHEFLGQGTVAVSGIWSRSPSQCAVADGCGISLDRRLTLGEDRQLALRQIRELPGGAQAEVSLYHYSEAAYTGKVYPTEKYYPTWLLEQDHPVMQGARKTYESLFGGDAPTGKWVFSTNGVAICGMFDIPCFGFGPGEERQAHAPNEYNSIDQLQKCVAFYAAWPRHHLAATPYSPLTSE